MENKSQLLSPVPGVQSAAPPGFTLGLPGLQFPEVTKVIQSAQVPGNRVDKKEIPLGNVISCSDLEAALLGTSLNMKSEKYSPGALHVMSPIQHAPSQLPTLQHQQNMIRHQQQHQQPNVVFSKIQQQKLPTQQQTNIMSPQEQQQKDMMLIIEQQNMMNLQQQQVVVGSRLSRHQQSNILSPQLRQQQSTMLSPQLRGQQENMYSFNKVTWPLMSPLQKPMLPLQQLQQQQTNSFNKNNLKNLTLPLESQQLLQSMPSPLQQQRQQQDIFSINQHVLPVQNNMTFPQQQQKIMSPQQQQKIMSPQQQQKIMSSQQQQKIMSPQQQNNAINKNHLKKLTLPLHPQQQGMSSPQQETHQQFSRSGFPTNFSPLGSPFPLNRENRPPPPPPGFQTPSFLSPINMCQSLQGLSYDNIKSPQPWSPARQATESRSPGDAFELLFNGLSINSDNRHQDSNQTTGTSREQLGDDQHNYKMREDEIDKEVGLQKLEKKKRREARLKERRLKKIENKIEGARTTENNKGKSYSNQVLIEPSTLKEPMKDTDNGSKPENDGNESSANKKKKKKGKKKQSGSKDGNESTKDCDELKSGAYKLVMSPDGKETVTLVVNEQEKGKKDCDEVKSGSYKLVMSPDGKETVTLDEKNQHEKGKTRKSRKKKKEESFQPYISPEEVEKGLADKKLFQNDLRINPKNHCEAYISDADNGQDIVILGLVDRNRSLEGDIVVVQLKDEAEWHKASDGTPCRTGKVVFVAERVHHGTSVGSLRVRKKGLYMFVPRDPRFPLLRIPSTAIPQNLLNSINENENLSDILYKAVLLSWNTPKYANGIIQDVVGKKGDICCETAAIFMELGLNKNPIHEKYNRHLPSLPFIITQDEIDSRLDLRSEVIFTIDPATARDLDDAVSIKKLNDGTYEVGVHIADVTHFLKEGTPLDVEVSERATTVYMVEKAYHMLPIVLCGLCSLLPGEDKLAISVIMKLDEEGNVLDTKFYRTVINSCAQLTYDHAQAMIDNDDVELPMLFNDVSRSTIKEAILSLNKIAVHRRKQRFDNGALKIDQPKVAFSLTSDFSPEDMYIYEIKDSHRLIEEFMLLANELVARHIHSKYPDIALLRRHDPPKMDMMTKLENSLQKLGIFLDSTCAGSLHTSLNKYCAGDPLRTSVLYQICTKPLQRAMYCCAESMTHHYALNVDKYTHFTSPIRRYADIVVHRILTACLGYSPLPAWSKKDVKNFAATSNRKKYAAKKASDMSSNLFRAIYIRNAGGMIVEAVVAGVNSRSVDVTIPSLAHNLRVYLENLETVNFEYHDNDIGSTIIVEWPGRDEMQVLQIFTPVKLHLTVHEKSPTIIEGKLLPPES